VLRHRAHDIVAGVEALGNLGRRMVAWLVLVAAAALLVRILWGVVAGFLHAVLVLVALVVAITALMWARRRV
jgi:hypothetical protein